MIFVSYSRRDAVPPGTDAVHLTPPDSFGHRRRVEALRAAVQASPACDPNHDELQYQLAVAVGHCYLTGTPAAGTPLRLSADVAKAALRSLRERLPRWQSEVSNLRRDHAEAQTPAEADAIAFRWVLVRTDLWALIEAARLSEEHLDESSDPAAAEVSAALSETMRAFDRFDTALEECKPVLATQVHRSDVRSLRDSLADEYRVPLPWWLDPASFRGVVPDRPHFRGSTRR